MVEIEKPVYIERIVEVPVEKTVYIERVVQDENPVVIERTVAEYCPSCKKTT